MIRLMIDGKVAVLKAGTSFKLTRMNPYFEDQGDFTFEVQLPLDGCAENLAIFGALHRAEVGVAGWANVELPMHLIAPPVDVVGVAKVMTVTDAEVKVQLLAGKSAVNDFGKDANGNDLYIDELDLGLKLENPNTPVGFQEGYDKDHLFVTFPVRDGEGMIVNYPKWKYWAKNDVVTEKVCKYENYAVQPYLATVINAIFKALGYVKKWSVFDTSWLKGVFVANNAQTSDVNDMLPHWTVAEFFKELQRTFGVYLEVKESVDVRGKVFKTVNLIGLSSHYEESADAVLTRVTDELTTDIDHDDGKTTLEGNTDYEHGSIPGVVRLPDEVWEKAIVMTFNNETLLRQWVGQHVVSDEEKATSKWLFVDLNLKRTHAFLKSAKDGKFYLAEVDLFPPLIKNGPFYGATTKRDINTRLRIVPLQMGYQSFEYEWVHHSADGGEDVLSSTFDGYPVLVSQTQSVVVPEKQAYSVNDAIGGDGGSGKSRTKPDKLEVALNSCVAWGKQPDLFPYKLALGINLLPTDDGFYLPLTVATNAAQPFRLQPSAHDDVCVGRNLAFAERIKTAAEHQFVFLDDVELDPTATYVIKGKRYACHKMEVTIDTNGVQPLKRGYFYEIE